MDDLEFGKRNKRGDWSPNAAAATAPLFVFPPQPLNFLKWLPHCFLPYNLLFALSALTWWYWVVPPVEVMQTLAWGWALKLFVINVVAVIVWFGAFEVHLYIRRAQGGRFRYNGKFPADTPSDVFWFNSQNFDNFLRGMLSGGPIWTAFQVIVFWAFANGCVSRLSFADRPVEHAARFATIFWHVGFDKVEVTDETAIDSHAYIHYLHHRYFEVDCGDGLIPFDKWFGTFHDGSAEGKALMDARFHKRRAKANAKAA